MHEKGQRITVIFEGRDAAGKGGAIRETLIYTHTAAAPWHVIRAYDKRRARLAVIRQILSQYEYPEKDPKLASAPDPAISGWPEACIDQGDDAQTGLSSRQFASSLG